MKQMGTGTQKVQEELERLFPGISVDRMDTDTVSAVNTHEKILDHFKNENTAHPQHRTTPAADEFQQL